MNCFALILLVLIQKGKGSMGLGSMGGGTTMLFGGSGGQDFFQKLTWVLGSILMGGSLLLGLLKSSTYNVKYLNLKDTTAQEEALPAGEVLAQEAKAAETAATPAPETAKPASPTTAPVETAKPAEAAQQAIPKP